MRRKTLRKVAILSMGISCLPKLAYLPIVSHLSSEMVDLVASDFKEVLILSLFSDIFSLLYIIILILIIVISIIYYFYSRQSTTAA